MDILKELSGSGSGYGYGSGSGYGYGYGDGSGYGYGYGSGYGSGDVGIVVGEIEQYDVLHLAPWPYVKVGCHTYPIKHWREHWSDIAENEGISVSKEKAGQIFKALENVE